MKQKHNVTAEKLGIQLSTGTLAGLAGGAVTISLGETSVFVSATAASTLRTGQDFFPLTVDYKEKFTAAGKFPGVSAIALFVHYSPRVFLMKSR